MQLSPKNPKVKNRMDKWHTRGSHTEPENAVKAKTETPKENVHVETLKRGFGIILDGLKSLGSEENLNRLGELGRNADRTTKEMGFFSFPGEEPVKRKRKHKRSKSST